MFRWNTWGHGQPRFSAIRSPPIRTNTFLSSTSSCKAPRICRARWITWFTFRYPVLISETLSLSGKKATRNCSSTPFWRKINEHSKTRREKNVLSLSWIGPCAFPTWNKRGTWRRKYNRSLSDSRKQTNQRPTTRLWRTQLRHLYIKHTW